MTTRAHRVVGFQNVALFVDQIANAFGESGFGIVTGTVGQTQRAVGIAEQEEGKTILLREGGILSY